MIRSLDSDSLEMLLLPFLCARTYVWSSTVHVFIHSEVEPSDRVVFKSYLWSTPGRVTDETHHGRLRFLDTPDGRNVNTNIE